VAVDDTAVLIAFARTADANLDGLVNDDDVTVVGATYAPGAANANWAAGDFDFNGFVDDDDVTLLGVFYEPPAAAVMARSPDRATATTAGLPALRTAVETFGQDDVRGQAFDELNRAETRAQQLVSGESWGIEHDLVDLLAESITTDNEPQSPSLAESDRPAIRRSPVLDSVWEHWKFEAV
jgi:hypothetical protein